MHNKIDLNPDAGFMEVGKYILSNKTLNTHETGHLTKEPEVGAKKVRSWCEPSEKEVERLKRQDKGSDEQDNSDQ